MKMIIPLVLIVAVLMASGCTSIDISEIIVPGSLYPDVHAYVSGTCDGLLDEVWEYRTKISYTTGELVYIAAYPDLPQAQSDGDPINIIQTSSTIDVIVCDSQRGYDGTGNCYYIPIDDIEPFEELTMTIEIDQGSCYEPPPVEPPVEPPVDDIDEPPQTYFDMFINWIRSILSWLGL